MAQREPRPYQGVLNQERADLIRQLHREGARMLHLSYAFGWSLGSVESVIHGRTWRGEPCKGCWRTVTSRDLAGYCETCKRQFCQRCGAAKNPGRKSDRCPPCDRENFANSVRRNDRCRDCGEQLPETRKDRICADCRSEGQAFQARFRNNAGRVCAKEGCLNLVPPQGSWTRSLCRPCANEHDRIQRSLRRRYCTVPGCGKQLHGDTKNTRCRQHANEARQMAKVAREFAALPEEERRRRLNELIVVADRRIECRRQRERRLNQQLQQWEDP